MLIYKFLQTFTNFICKFTCFGNHKSGRWLTYHLSVSMCLQYSTYVCKNIVWYVSRLQDHPDRNLLIYKFLQTFTNNICKILVWWLGGPGAHGYFVPYFSWYFMYILNTLGQINLVSGKSLICGCQNKWIYK